MDAKAKRAHDNRLWKIAVDNLTPPQVCRLIDAELKLKRRTIDPDFQFVGLGTLALSLQWPDLDALEERLDAIGVKPDVQLHVTSETGPGYTEPGFRASRLPFIRAMLVCLPASLENETL